MSGYDTESQTILDRLKVGWADRTPVDWPNTGYKPTAGTPWIRPTILASYASRKECGVVGSRTFRHFGLLLIQVFTPERKGDGTAAELAEALCALFRGASADGVTYEGPTGEAPTARADGNDGAGWYQWTVTVPYTRDTLY